MKILVSVALFGLAVFSVSKGGAFLPTIVSICLFLEWVD